MEDRTNTSVESGRGTDEVWIGGDQIPIELGDSWFSSRNSFERWAYSLEMESESGGKALN